MHVSVCPLSISPVAIVENNPPPVQSPIAPKDTSSDTSLFVYSPGPIVTSTQPTSLSAGNSAGEGLLPVTVKVKSDGSYCPLFSPIISLQTLNVAVSGSGSGSGGGVGGPISLITPYSVAAEAVFYGKRLDFLNMNGMKVELALQ